MVTISFAHPFHRLLWPRRSVAVSALPGYGDGAPWPTAGNQRQCAKEMMTDDRPANALHTTVIRSSPETPEHLDVGRPRPLRETPNVSSWQAVRDGHAYFLPGVFGTDFAAVAAFFFCVAELDLACF